MSREFTTLLWLAKHTYSKWYLKHNHVTTSGLDKIDFKKGAYLIISNHCGAYDPVIISSIVPRTVRWVTGAYLFKQKFLNFVFAHVCRCIAKQQGQSDLSTMRAMQKNLREGNVVGIFPEGTRTWDGDMMPYSKTALAKMIKIFSVSTVFVNLEGCFAQQPRWADYYRTGRGVNVNFRKVLTSDEIKTMTIPDLEACLTENFDFSNDIWKKHTDYDFESEHRAEGLQKFLYMCPVCKNIGCMNTQGDKIECALCGADATVTPDDDINSEKIGYKHFSEWHEWEKTAISSVKVLKEEKAVLFQSGILDNKGKLKTVSKDLSVRVDNDVMYISCSEGKSYTFKLDEISSFILNAKQTMEFVSDGMVYRLRLLPSSSALKFQEYYFAHRA